MSHTATPVANSIKSLSFEKLSELAFIPCADPAPEEVWSFITTAIEYLSNGEPELAEINRRIGVVVALIEKISESFPRVSEESSLIEEGVDEGTLLKRIASEAASEYPTSDDMLNEVVTGLVYWVWGVDTGESLKMCAANMLIVLETIKAAMN